MFRTLGTRETEKPPFTTCTRDGDAAWMFFPRSASVEWLRPEPDNMAGLPPNEASPAIEIRYQLVYASGDALIVSEPMTYRDDAYNIMTDLITILGVSDMDGDGRSEFAVLFSQTVYEESAPMNYQMFTAQDDGVVPYAAIDGIPIVRFEDFDADGRLDIISDSVWSAATCGLDPPPEPMPPVLYHAQQDGTFSTSSRAAADYLRTHCPSSPGRLVPEIGQDVEYGTLLNVSCARAWGASADEVQAQLRREYPDVVEEDNYCMYTLDETLQWAEIDPPVRLDQVR